MKRSRFSEEQIMAIANEGNQQRAQSGRLLSFSDCFNLQIPEPRDRLQIEAISHPNGLRLLRYNSVAIRPAVSKLTNACVSRVI
jgi:hypothetical protein